MAAHPVKEAEATLTNKLRRARILETLGARESDLQALLEHTANHFALERVQWPLALPLEDEPHVVVWESYAETLEREGSIQVLTRVFPQLRFPIAAGVSKTDDYRAATRRGEPCSGSVDSDIALSRPDRVRIVIRQTAAGRIPLLIVGQRDDFVKLVRAFTMRNEPGPVPDSQGACMVSGYNNWDRIRAYRQDWEVRTGGTGVAWETEFAALVARQHLYQDRFVIVSGGPYSAVSSEELALSDASWQDISLSIRMEHECTHYFTKRVFGSMRNRLHDEFLADFAGIAAACGRYRADWFLRFMGLEHHPKYRAGGRLENYGGDVPLSRNAFAVLQELVVRSAHRVNTYCMTLGDALTDPRERMIVVVALAHLTLEQLADDSGGCLESAVSTARGQLKWRRVAGG